MELPLTKLRRASNLSKKYSKFPDGDLYMLIMTTVQHDKYTLTTQTSKSFSLQKLYTFMLEN